MQNNGEILVNNNNFHMTIFLKLTLLTFGMLLFKYFGTNNIIMSSAKNETSNASDLTQTEDPTKVTSTIDVDIQQPIKVKVVQPECTRQEVLLALNHLCVEFRYNQSSCQPEDVNNLEKHKIPMKTENYYSSKSRSNNDNQSNVVNYLVGGLLITSLSAALLELYKAKFQHGGKSPGGDRKSKTPLSRKCSLADLTVLKHHRKELVRRESILEIMPEEGVAMREKQLQAALLQQGFTPPPLHRRCSFPVAHTLTMSDIHQMYCNSGNTNTNIPPTNDNSLASTRNGRRPSLDQSNRCLINYNTNRRLSVISSNNSNHSSSANSHQSISLGTDSRRTSVFDGMMNSRKMSLTLNEDGHERTRHHSRLMHRH